MIAGLPWQTWLLVAAAVLPGLLLAGAFRRAHGDRCSEAASDPAE